MKTYTKANRLATRLYFLSIIALVLSIVLIGKSIYFEFQEADKYAQEESFTSGYKMPVETHLDVIADTLMHYHNENGMPRQLGSYNWDKSERKQYEEILKDSTVEKAFVYNSAEVRNKDFHDISENFSFTNARLSGTVLVKSTKFWIRALLGFRHYFFLLILMFIFWQLINFFGSLRKEVSFSIQSTLNIQRVGLAIFWYQIVSLIILMIAEKDIMYAEFYEVVDGISHSSTQLFKLTPTTGFDIGWCFIGLGLVALSYLLVHGNDLKEDNELKI